MIRNTLFWGLVLIILGVLLLLNTLGILSVNVWGLIWPFFLIALGIWILTGAIFRKSVVEHVKIPLEGATGACLQVRHGAGRLDIHAGAGEGDLVEGDFGGGLDLNTRRENGILNIQMSVPPQSFPTSRGSDTRLDWSFGLAPGIPLSLDLETGANESNFDLRQLLVAEVRLKSGASSTNLNLPLNAGFTCVGVETGAASVRIWVPEGVAAHVRAQGGLASIHLDSRRFPRLGDAYETPDFAVAENKVDIDIQAGVGSVEIY